MLISYLQKQLLASSLFLEYFESWIEEGKRKDLGAGRGGELCGSAAMIDGPMAFRISRTAGFSQSYEYHGLHLFHRHRTSLCAPIRYE
jgi:hypothetical protein